MGVVENSETCMFNEQILEALGKISKRSITLEKQNEKSKKILTALGSEHLELREYAVKIAEDVYARIEKLVKDNP